MRGIYLGNYLRWDSKRQHEEMIRLYGFESAPQERTFNTYEDVENLHLAGTHDYIKFLKYGYGKVSDHASREIRLRRMTREEGIEMVRQYSRRIPADLPLFLKWAGMTESEFYECVDRFRDPRIWGKGASEQWRLLDSIEEHAGDPGVEDARLAKIEECRFDVTPSREPDAVENEQILMGRGYLNKYNQWSVDDTPYDGPLPEIRR